MDSIQSVVEDEPDAIPTLFSALELEDTGMPNWSWSDVNTHPRVLAHLARCGVITVDGVARNVTNYRLTDREFIRAQLPRIDESKIPNDPLFTEIVAYEAVKAGLKVAIYSERPMHCLLIGEKGTAKSLFLDDLRTLPGSLFVLGGQTTKAGLTRWLMDKAPSNIKYICIDEIDKMSRGDQAVLLELMESGLVREMKTERTGEKRFKVWIFAAGNHEEDLTDELLSRFMKFNFEPYNEADYMEVVRRVLMIKEGCDPEISEYISTRAWVAGLTNVRDAVKIARGAKTLEEVDFMINILTSRGPYGM